MAGVSLALNRLMPVAPLTVTEMLGPAGEPRGQIPCRLRLSSAARARIVQGPAVPGVQW